MMNLFKMSYYRNVLFIIIGFLAIPQLFAQQPKSILFSIDKEQISVAEFEHIYNKNYDALQDKSQQNIDNYLDLYLNFKLKIHAAKKLGLDTLSTYKKELATYREQLIEPYLKDDALVQKLVLEAYERLKRDINASHILIEIAPQEAPKDTLEAYAKILALRNRIVNGENFETIAIENSQDPSVKENKGNLGYFSAFNMVYPFETACYNTAIGAISMPFRTQFGYHIVTINDNRPTLGEVEVAHIMFKSTEKESQIDEVYQKILKGEDFGMLAKHYSVDQNTSHNSGKLAKFRSGRLVKDFEDVAFNLEENKVSKPFKTVYGWHIVKLLKKHPLKSLEDLQHELTLKVQNDQRSEIIVNKLAANLVTKYKYFENQPIISKLFELDKIKDDEILFSIYESKNTVKQFKDFVNQHPKKSIHANFLAFRNTKLIDYHKNNLENENSDFAAIMNEYKEGLLLFEILQHKIWNASTTDTLGLKLFYEQRIHEYQWGKRIKASIITAENEISMNNVKEYLKNGHLVENIKKDFTKNNQNIDVKSGIFEEESLHLPNNFELKVGGSTMYLEDGTYKLILVNEVVEPTAKTFEEARGKLINDYQNYLDIKWVEALRKEYKLKINQKELKKLKLKYHQYN